MFYAGIGSSKGVCQSELDMLTLIAKQLNKKGYGLRSGAAPCVDTAFELGAGINKEIFLPWKGFNGSKSQLYLDVLKDVDKASNIATNLYGEFYKDSHRKLHARNVYQIMGPNLCDPVEFVLAYTYHDPKKRKGGTCLGMNLAYELGIPVYNLYHTFDQIMFAEEYNIEIYKGGLC